MKAVEGAALLVGAAAGEVVAPELSSLWLNLALTGGSMVVEGIAQALEGSQGSFSVRQAAAPAQAIYGFQRVSGTIVWVSTSGSKDSYLHLIIVWAMHPCESIESIWVDSRQVFFDGQGGEGPLSGDNAVLNMQGQVVSGNALNQTFHDVNGNSYNFNKNVCCYNHLGGNTSKNPFSAFLTPNDPSYPSDSYFNGLTASYIKLTWNSNLFNGGIPDIRASIRGKNDIYDPRTKTTGYSQNMALCIANMLTDKEIGVGCDYNSEIDEPQLIAAANACDEQVDLANGKTESRYECNGAFQCNSSPGDIIQSMCNSCAGRLTYTGGLYGIYPGVWTGLSSNTITPANVIEAPSYTPTRKYRDLVNMCTGTFICPTYPWAVGYSYDYQDPVNQVFNGCFQPTNFPYWTNDSFHGYPSSVSYITADQGRTLTKDIKLQFVMSVACAQRIAKINVMRNRWQASAKFKTNLALWNTTALDNIEVTFPYLELANSVFEVQQFQFDVTSDPGDPSKPPIPSCALTLQATDSSIYDWSTSEELGLTITESPTIYNSFQVTPPTELVLTSGAGVAFKNEAGIVTGGIRAQWTAPDDAFIAQSGYMEVQWSPAGAGTWSTSGMLSGASTFYTITPVLGGSQYDVRVRGIRNTGVSTEWAQVSAYIVSTTETTIDSQDVFYSDGTPIENLKPAQAGSDVTAQAGLVLLQNPNFLQGATGWVAQTGWNAASKVVANPVSSSAYIGEFSGTTTAALTNKQTIPCGVGDVVSATAMMKASDAGCTGTLQLEVSFFESSQTFISSVSAKAAVSDWKTYRAVGTAPANTVYAQVRFAIYNPTTTDWWGVANCSASLLPHSLDEVPNGVNFVKTNSTYVDSSGNITGFQGQGALATLSEANTQNIAANAVSTQISFQNTVIVQCPANTTTVAAQNTLATDGGFCDIRFIAYMFNQSGAVSHPKFTMYKGGTDGTVLQFVGNLYIPSGELQAQPVIIEWVDPLPAASQQYTVVCQTDSVQLQLNPVMFSITNFKV